MVLESGIRKKHTGIPDPGSATLVFMVTVLYFAFLLKQRISSRSSYTGLKTERGINSATENGPNPLQFTSLFAL